MSFLLLRTELADGACVRVSHLVVRPQQAARLPLLLPLPGQTLLLLLQLLLLLLQEPHGLQQFPPLLLRLLAVLRRGGEVGREKQAG